MRDERVGITIHPLKPQSEHRLCHWQRCNWRAQTHNDPASIHQPLQAARISQPQCRRSSHRRAAATFAAPPHVITCLHQCRANPLAHCAGMQKTHCPLHCLCTNERLLALVLGRHGKLLKTARMRVLFDRDCTRACDAMKGPQPECARGDTQSHVALQSADHARHAP